MISFSLSVRLSVLAVCPPIWTSGQPRKMIFWWFLEFVMCGLGCDHIGYSYCSFVWMYFCCCIKGDMTVSKHRIDFSCSWGKNRTYEYGFFFSFYRSYITWGSIWPKMDAKYQLSRSNAKIHSKNHGIWLNIPNWRLSKWTWSNKFA